MIEIVDKDNATYINRIQRTCCVVHIVLVYDKKTTRSSDPKFTILCPGGTRLIT